MACQSQTLANHLRKLILPTLGELAHGDLSSWNWSPPPRQECPHSCPSLSPLTCIHSIVPTDNCKLSQLTNLKETNPTMRKQERAGCFLLSKFDSTSLVSSLELLLLLQKEPHIQWREPLPLSTTCGLSGLLSCHLTSSWHWQAYWSNRKERQQEKEI